MMMNKAPLTLLVFLSLVAGPVLAQSTGQALFEKRCYSCHNIGGGPKKGPDLKGVPQLEKPAWLRRFIPSPQSMVRTGDPRSKELFAKFAPEVMPDQDLTVEQIDALLLFITDVGNSGKNFVPSGARLSRPITPADVPAGRQLFTGVSRLQGGAPPCISCHSLDRIGSLGGGTLGPDLTAANVKYRDAELIAILQNPAFPTMASIFGTRPMNAEEVVKLFALLQNARMTAPPERLTTTPQPVNPWFAVLGLSAVLPTLWIFNLAWKKRIRGGIRKALVERSNR